VRAGLGGADAHRVSASARALLFFAYLGALLLVYEPALEGPFVSDDLHYVAANPYVHELGGANLWAILRPFGPATTAVVNYAPVQLLLHAAAWELFGDRVAGHHLVNLALHAAASVLLLSLLLTSGVPQVGALLGSLFFLLHPANVEAVAWISQLKSSAALVLALLALLAHPRRPALGAALFALALLAKPTAAVALPVAFLLEWVRAGRVRWRWLAVWAAALAAFAWVELVAHQRADAADAALHATPSALLRSMAALALRYLVMAATSCGVSAFHEPAPARSAFDPRWLTALPVLALLAWRLVVTLRARSEECVYWIWALASFAPVSQIFPFLYPLADRYLYFILPGLIGAAALSALDLARRLPPRRRARARRAGAVLLVALCALFAWHSHERAAIWRSAASVVADAARHYPDGVSAHLLRAKRAAQRGDVDAAVTALRAARARGYNRYEQLLSDPAFQPIRTAPAFAVLIAEMAGDWLEAGRHWRDPTQGELRKLASAHVARGEFDEAVALLRRALERGGPFDAAIRADLAALGGEGR
jgi:tetratricopeptide (TPR) repeat protein